jgi:hypothetical protein
VAVGDSVRFLGRVGGLNGQRVIRDGQAIILEFGGDPTPVRVTTGDAAIAGGGTLDAELVLVVDGTIGSDTVTVAGDYQFSVDDGTGPILVVLDFHAGLTKAPFIPGAVIDATGVLVPDGTGAWRLKPRTNVDLDVK